MWARRRGRRTFCVTRPPEASPWESRVCPNGRARSVGRPLMSRRANDSGASLGVGLKGVYVCGGQQTARQVLVRSRRLRALDETSSWWR